MPEKDEKLEAVYSYTVTRYANGSADVAPVEVDGKSSISKEDAYSDILAVAKMIEEQRDTNRTRVAAYQGYMAAYSEIKAAEAASASKVDTTSADSKN